MNKGTVLLIEDDPVQRELALGWLHEAGHEVVAVRSGDLTTELEGDRFVFIAGSSSALVRAIARHHRIDRSGRGIIVAVPAGQAPSPALVDAGARVIGMPYERSALMRAIVSLVSERDRRELSAVHRSLLAASRVDELPESIVRSAMEALGAEDASLLLLGPDHRLRLAYSSRIPREEWDTVRIPLGGGIAGRVASTKKPEILRDPVEGREGGLETVRTSVVYPLASEDRLLGVLNLSRSSLVSPGAVPGAGVALKHPPFVHEDIARTEVFASAVELALENAELTRRMIHSDRRTVLTHLAGGLAHELNTPVQFSQDNLSFLEEAFDSLLRAHRDQRRLIDRPGVVSEARAQMEAIESEQDLDFLLRAVPSAIRHIRDGLRRIGEIVVAVKRLSETELQDFGSANLDEALKTAIELARGRLSPVAELELDLTGTPPVRGQETELAEAFLAIIENSIRAVGSTRERGKIVITSRVVGSDALVSIHDTGLGIPESIRGRIYDPFFTTQEVGDGRGMGLTIARTIIVERCGGELTFESKEGCGTTFFVRLRTTGGSPRGAAAVAA